MTETLEVDSHTAGLLFVEFGDFGVDHPIYPVAHIQHSGSVSGNNNGLVGFLLDDIA